MKKSGTLFGTACAGMGDLVKYNKHIESDTMDEKEGEPCCV